MAELASMLNIGKEMTRKLSTVGISSAEMLIEVGSKQAFSRLKALYPQVCLVHLYALEGAIQHVEYNSLSPSVRKELRTFCDSLKQLHIPGGD